MFLVLDNAESILDPQGTDAREIYAVVEELSQLDNVCLCITSRISTIPPDCETLDIPTLSIEAARDAFYRIYKNGEQSELVDNILAQLDFHALCITLLATVAHHSKWDLRRLTREWEQRRTGVLQTGHNKSLAAAIELSLSSPMFQELGPDARELLGVVAFFPQGVNENNLDWLFPTIPNRANAIDKLCILSLTHWSNGFITMLAPLRDYLSPKDPKSSLLLCMIKELYIWMSAVIDPNKSDFEGTRWIMSEDVNVEHLLDVFTTVDPNSGSVWVACANFVEHLRWHKKTHHYDTTGQAECLDNLALLLRDDKQLGAAEEAAFRAITLLPEKGQEHRLCKSHQTLGKIYRSKGEIKKAIHHFEVALGIASSFNRHDRLFWIHYKLAGLFYGQCRFEDAQAHLERTKLHALDNAYHLGLAMELQAQAWYLQHRLEGARTEALAAADVYEKLGTARKVEDCKKLLRKIEDSLAAPVNLP